MLNKLICKYTSGVANIILIKSWRNYIESRCDSFVLFYFLFLKQWSPSRPLIYALKLK